MSSYICTCIRRHLAQAMPFGNKQSKCSCGRAQPTFGMPGGESATHCKECREHGMIDVKNPKCQCAKSQPSFGMPGGRATCCKDCKEPGMIDVSHMKCSCGSRAVHYSIDPTFCELSTTIDQCDIRVHKYTHSIRSIRLSE